MARRGRKGAREDDGDLVVDGSEADSSMKGSETWL